MLLDTGIDIGRSSAIRKLPTAYSGIKLWLDGSDVDSITKDGGDNISQWNDKSGNGNHATQVTGVNQPLFTPNHINNKSVVTFDGGTEEMNLSSLLSLSSEFTMFFVANNENTTSSRLIFGHDTDTNKIGTLNPTLAFERMVNGGANDFTQPYLAQSKTGIEILQRDSLDKIDIAFNGGAFTRIFGDVAVSGVSSWNRIGGDNTGLNWMGDVAEIIIYDRALSDVERTSIIDYLTNKWLVGSFWENVNTNWENMNVNWETLT